MRGTDGNAAHAAYAFALVGQLGILSIDCAYGALLRTQAAGGAGRTGLGNHAAARLFIRTVTGKLGLADLIGCILFQDPVREQKPGSNLPIFIENWTAEKRSDLQISSKTNPARKIWNSLSRLCN